MLKQNGKMRRIKFSLTKMIQRHNEFFIKYNKSIEEVMQAVKYKLKRQKSNIFFYIHFLHIVHMFILSVFLKLFIYTFYILFIFLHK